MKRTASILLLAILVFNWIGYQFISGMFEYNADIALEASIDRSDYDESSLIELRVPLNAPYLAGMTGAFERYNGEIEIEGVHYKYVKRKITEGELVLMCLPNESKTRFQNSRVEFFKLVNDLNTSSGSQEKKSSSSSKSLALEYSRENNFWTVLSSLERQAIDYAFLNNSLHLSAYRDVIKPPPRA